MLIYSLVPRSHHLQGIGSGNIGVTSWLCALYHFIACDHPCYLRRLHSVNGKRQPDFTSYEVLSLRDSSCSA